jgi:hypothetical protein
MREKVVGFLVAQSPGPFQPVFQVHFTDFVQGAGAGVPLVERTTAGQRKHGLQQTLLGRAYFRFHDSPLVDFKKGYTAPETMTTRRLAMTVHGLALACGDR